MKHIDESQPSTPMLERCTQAARAIMVVVKSPQSNATNEGQNSIKNVVPSTRRKENLEERNIKAIIEESIS